MSKISKKIISLILALLMILTVIPMNAAAAEEIVDTLSAEEPFKFGFVSDLHYYPKVLTGDYCDAFMTEAESSIGRNVYQSEALLESARAAYAEHAKENGMKYLIVSGDLTSNARHEPYTRRLR